MSWTSVRSYFRTHCAAEGLTEWTDGFSVNNIPSDILDGAYHMEYGDFLGVSHTQYDLETTVGVILRFFKKGYADPQYGIDDSVLIAESLTKRLVKAENRFGQDFKNIVFERMTINPIGDSNDNKILVEMEFTVRAILGADS